MIAFLITGAALADWWIRSAILVALAWGASAVAQRAHAPAALRHLIWVLAIFAAAALPLATTMAPLHFNVLPVVLEAPARTIGASGVSAGFSLSELMSGLYIAIGFALLVRVLLGQRRLHACWRRALRVASIEREAAEVAQVIGLKQLVAVRIADIGAPMMWGAATPKVAMPAEAMGWPLARRRLVLMHEFTHARRGDGAVQLLVSLVLAFYWFQPALWFAAARLRREQEHACDEHVLLRGGARHEYAHALLETAAAGRSIAEAVAMAAPSQLEARLKAIVEGRPRRLGRVSGAIAVSVAFAVLMAAAMLAPAVSKARVAEEAAAMAVPVVAHIDRRALRAAAPPAQRSAPTLQSHQWSPSPYRPSPPTLPTPATPPTPPIAALPAIEPVEPTEPITVLPGMDAVPDVAAVPAIVAVEAVPPLEHRNR